MKKFFSLIALFVMAISFSACGSDNDNDDVTTYNYGIFVEVTQDILDNYDDLQVTFSAPGLIETTEKVTSLTWEKRYSSNVKGTVKGKLTGTLNTSKIDDDKKYRIGRSISAKASSGSIYRSSTMSTFSVKGKTLKAELATITESEDATIE